MADTLEPVSGALGSSSYRFPELFCFPMGFPLFGHIMSTWPHQLQNVAHMLHRAILLRPAWAGRGGIDNGPFIQKIGSRPTRNDDRKLVEAVIRSEKGSAWIRAVPIEV